MWVVLLKVALKQSDLPKCLVALREMRDLFDDTSVAEATGSFFIFSSLRAQAITMTIKTLNTII